MNLAPQEEKKYYYLIVFLVKQVRFVQPFSSYSDFKKESRTQIVNYVFVVSF